MSKENQLSFIVYEYKKSPRFFEIKKRTLRLFFILFPAISIFFFIAGTISIYQLHVVMAKKETTLVTKMRTKIEGYEKEIAYLNDSKNSLEKIISAPENAISDEFSLFSVPKSHQDLSDKKIFDIEDFSIKFQDTSTNVKFNIVNITPNNQKQSGYFHVVLKTPAGILFFPETILQNSGFVIGFNSGEQFTTSRFRPVNASFDIGITRLQSYKEKKVAVKIIVFDREGNLLHSKTIYPEI